jgi:hypothetical protein
MDMLWVLIVVVGVAAGGWYLWKNVSGEGDVPPGA